MLLLAAVSVACIAGAADGAFAGWSAASRVSGAGPSPGNGANYMHVGIDGRGDATAVWTERDGTDSPKLMVALRRSLGTWDPPQVLSPPGTAAEFAQLAVAPSGAAVAVWQVWQASGLRFVGPAYIDASVRRAGTDRWSTPVQLSPPGVFAQDPSLAIENNGSATAVWGYESIMRAGVGGVGVSTFDPRTSTWSGPSRIWARTAGPPQVALDARGDTIIAWSDVLHDVLSSYDVGAWADVTAVVRRAGSASWSAPATLGREISLPYQSSGTFDLVGPRVAIGRADEAIAVWQGGSIRVVWDVHKGRRAPKVIDHFVTDAAAESAGGHWRPAKPISSSDTGAFWPEVATSPSGYATVVWLGGDGNVWAASRSILGCCWTSPLPLTAKPGGEAHPRVAVDGLHDLIAGWTGAGLLVAMRKAHRTTWQRPVDLGPASTSGGGSQIAFNGKGDAVAVWPQVAKVNGVINTLVTTASYRRR